MRRLTKFVNVVVEGSPAGYSGHRGASDTHPSGRNGAMRCAYCGLRHIHMAEQFAQGRTFDSVRDDLMPLYAITRCPEIISEAPRRLSDELKARHPQIPWREMAAAGNFYRHNYEDVLPRRVWKTLHEDLPPLRIMVEQELGDHN